MVKGLTKGGEETPTLKRRSFLAANQMKSFITKNLGAFLKNKPSQPDSKNPTPKISSGKQITLTPELFKRKAFSDKELSLKQEKVYSAEEVAALVREEAKKSVEQRRRGR